MCSVVSAVARLLPGGAGGDPEKGWNLEILSPSLLVDTSCSELLRLVERLEQLSRFTGVEDDQAMLGAALLLIQQVDHVTQLDTLVKRR